MDAPVDGNAEGNTAAGAGEEKPSPAVQRVLESFPDGVLSRHAYRGDATLVIKREAVADVCRFLKTEPDLRFDLFLDLTAVDYLPVEPRFEVVIHLYSTPHGFRLRLKVPLAGDDPEMDSLTSVWRATDWFEREAWDMYGIVFRGHPNLKRILLYEEFEGHPLRKDYPIDKRQPLIGPKN